MKNKHCHVREWYPEQQENITSQVQYWTRIKQKKLFFLDDAQFSLSMDVNSQNNKCWCDKISHVIRDKSFVSP
jgi:hypothetical protein